jgi:hypothetical protein
MRLPQKEKISPTDFQEWRPFVTAKRRIFKIDHDGKQLRIILYPWDRFAIRGATDVPGLCVLKILYPADSHSGW